MIISWVEKTLGNAMTPLELIWIFIAAETLVGLLWHWKARKN